MSLFDIGVVVDMDGDDGPVRYAGDSSCFANELWMWVTSYMVESLKSLEGDHNVKIVLVDVMPLASSDDDVSWYRLGVVHDGSCSDDDLESYLSGCFFDTFETPIHDITTIDGNRVWATFHELKVVI